jgi:hypothetical protein
MIPLPILGGDDTACEREAFVGDQWVYFHYLALIGELLAQGRKCVGRTRDDFSARRMCERTGRSAGLLDVSDRHGRHAALSVRVECSPSK